MIVELHATVCTISLNGFPRFELQFFSLSFLLSSFASRLYAAHVINRVTIISQQLMVAVWLVFFFLCCCLVSTVRYGERKKSHPDIHGFLHFTANSTGVFGTRISRPIQNFIKFIVFNLRLKKKYSTMHFRIQCALQWWWAMSGFTNLCTVIRRVFFFFLPIL